MELNLKRKTKLVMELNEFLEEIKFIENKGWEFDKDKNMLWAEELVSELKWKEFFELLNEFKNKKNINY